LFARSIASAGSRPVRAGFAAGQRINIAHRTPSPAADISATDATLLSGSVLGDTI
jgi:hypothetical protein